MFCHLKHKSEVVEKFKDFEAIVTNKCGHGIVKLRTDNGGEYLSREFQEYLKSKGIQHELTIALTSTKWYSRTYESYLAGISSSYDGPCKSAKCILG